MESGEEKSHRPLKKYVRVYLRLFLMALFASAVTAASDMFSRREMPY
jgi:hypothetical protein